MAKILSLATGVNDDERMKSALETIDSLREAVASGQVKAFCAVGIEPDMTVRQWQASVKTTKYLELHGAVSSLMYSLHAMDE